MKLEKRSSKVNKKVLSPLKSRISGIRLTTDLISRVRWVLFVIAFLLLFLAFQVGDDWFVREFANYDWARSIGFCFGLLK
jgi:hypothetical protein